jgi:hypothetical protein
MTMYLARVDGTAHASRNGQTLCGLVPDEDQAMPAPQDRWCPACTDAIGLECPVCGELQRGVLHEH